MFFETVGFFCGEVYHSPVFGRCEIGGFHRTFVEVSQRSEVDEVGGLDEAEVVFGYSVAVIHQYPFVFADAFPHVGSLTCFRLRVNPLGPINETAVYFV